MCGEYVLVMNIPFGGCALFSVICSLVEKDMANAPIVKLQAHSGWNAIRNALSSKCAPIDIIVCQMQVIRAAKTCENNRNVQ